MTTHNTDSNAQIVLLMTLSVMLIEYITLSVLLIEYYSLHCQ